MSKWYKEMDCYILAGGENNPATDFKKSGDLHKLERSYRNYAKVFEKVKLVIKKGQAKEQYLNYPHVCDETTHTKPVVGVATALNDAESDAVFIGSSEIGEFSPALLVELVKNYNGESFLGYTDNNNPQPLFGIYNKRLAENLPSEFDSICVTDLLDQQARLLPLPEHIDAQSIGL